MVSRTAPLPCTPGPARALAVPAAALALCIGLTPAAAADAPAVVQTICAACHGADGNSIAPTFPRLAGLQVEYIEKQLKEFLSGKRKNEMMAPSLEGLKSGDVGPIAAYYAQLKPAPGTAGDATLSKAGKALYDDGNTDTGVPACAGCHQPEGVGNERYPRLAGQFASYTAAQMTAFKSGTRTNDKARVMRAVAERMSEQEIAAVAEYIAGL